MAHIKPISDLSDNFAEISRIVHEVKEPVYLTKNGYGDMVVMSIEQFEALQNTCRIDAALLEGERQALSGARMQDFGDVSSLLRQKLVERVGGNSA